MKHKLGILLALCASCAEARPIIKSVNDVARDLCAVFYSQRQAVSFDDAARSFCATERQLAPWIDEVLSAEHRASLRAAHAQDAGTD